MAPDYGITHEYRKQTMQNTPSTGCSEYLCRSDNWKIRVLLLGMTMGLAYGVVVAGIEAKSHFIDGSSTTADAGKPVVRPADSHQKSKASHVHSPTAEKVHHNKKAVLKKAELVEDTRAKLKPVVTPRPAVTKAKAEVKAKKATNANAEVTGKVAKDDDAVSTKVHKMANKAQDPAKPHLRKAPKAVALGEQLEIKKVEQKALAEVKHEVEVATAAQKKKQKSSLDDMLNVPEEDFEQSSATMSSSSGTVEDILKMEKELLEDEVVHPNDGTTDFDHLN